MRMPSYPVLLAVVGALFTWSASFASGGQLFAEMDPDVAYSAWRHVETRDGRMKMREHRAPGRMRFEMEQQGQRMVMILDEKAGESWMLMPEAKMVMKTSAGQVARTSGEEVEVLERTALGRENINGHVATKYRARFRDASGREGRGHFWLTVAHGIPVKMDMIQEVSGREERVRMELTDLEVGPQSAALFEVPGDYRAMPGGMGNLFGGGMAGGGPAARSGTTAAPDLEARERQTTREDAEQQTGSRAVTGGADVSRPASGEEAETASDEGEKNVMEQAADTVGDTAEKIKKGIGSFLNKF